jgi:FkbM family methyltransferase
MPILRIAGRFIYGKVLPKRPYRVLRGPLKGARFMLGSLSGAGGGASVYFDQVEPEQSSAFCTELQSGQTFFDVGANVGYYTILASRLVGRNGCVAAFEPVVRNLATLKQHLDLNYAHNVRLFPFAVSDVAGISSFTLGDDNAMGFLSANEGNGDLLVPTISLDEFAERSKLRPDVIKIDVEGAEVHVLTGARRVLEKCRPVIFLSTHSPELRGNCLGMLKEAGYAIQPLSDPEDSHEFLAKSTGA